jgi:uncharacterized protein YfeS
MEFHVMARSYNSYGGHTTLSPIGAFLLLGSKDFGEAVKEITVTLHFPCSGPPKKSLERLLEEYNRHRSTLPKITFHRTKGKVEIDVASGLMDGRDWKRSPQLSLPLFERGLEEVIQSTALMRKRLKASDSFDLEAFLAHCAAARQRVPSSENALQELAAELEAAAKAKRDAMSPWEKLGIDWEDFHPRAREILDDPFFWDCANDFSPNGNDTGADLLEAYRDWLKQHKDGQPIQFLERLVRQWGYPDIENMDDDVRDEAAVALAFADIKLRGLCDDEARALAITSIQRQRDDAEAAIDWSYREERLTALRGIEQKLQRQ